MRKRQNVFNVKPIKIHDFISLLPQKGHPAALEDYRLVALTSHVMNVSATSLTPCWG